MNKTRLNRLKYTLCMGIPAIITYLGSKVLQRDTVECEMFLPWMIESSPIWFGAVVTDLVRYVRKNSVDTAGKSE